MKPSELKKDHPFSLRMNSAMRAKLKDMGIGPQEVFDRALDQVIGRVDLTVTPHKKLGKRDAGKRVKGD
jgi:hypothetical protein